MSDYLNEMLFSRLGIRVPLKLALTYHTLICRWMDAYMHIYSTHDGLSSTTNPKLRGNYPSACYTMVQMAPLNLQKLKLVKKSSTIRKLHFIFLSFSRPLYLPLHVLLSLDSVSLSTNLVTGAPVLVLKLVVDGTYLSLANQQQRSSGSGVPNSTAAMHHVCVLEMEWFELTLRLCDNSQFGGDYQKVHVHNRFLFKLKSGYSCMTKLQ